MGSANFHVLPERFLAGGLEDRRLGQRLGFLRRRHRGIEVALGGGLLGSGARCRGRGPLIAQRTSLLVGGFSGGIGSAEISFGGGLQRRRARAQQDKRQKDGC